MKGRFSNASVMAKLPCWAQWFAVHRNVQPIKIFCALSNRREASLSTITTQESISWSLFFYILHTVHTTFFPFILPHWDFFLSLPLFVKCCWDEITISCSILCSSIYSCSRSSWIWNAMKHSQSIAGVPKPFHAKAPHISLASGQGSPLQTYHASLSSRGAWCQTARSTLTVFDVTNDVLTDRQLEIWV